MRSSFDKAFEIVVGLEGKLSIDPADPGNRNKDGSPGFTIWGLSSRYNKGVTREMTLEQAKDKYLYSYWIPAGCDHQPYPLDICLFDGAVNPQDDPDLPGVGNQEIMALNPENWQDFLLMRMARYVKRSKQIYVKGHLQRVVKLYKAIKAG